MATATFQGNGYHDHRYYHNYNHGAASEPPGGRSGPRTIDSPGNIAAQQDLKHNHSKSSTRHEIEPLLDVPATKKWPTASHTVEWTDGGNPANVPQVPKPLRQGPTKDGWCPIYLRRTFLLSFAAACVVLICLLAGLYRYSEKYQGLGQFREQWHYIFKYGPTAVLTVFAALWAQVEYRTKQLAPWNAMSNGPTSAKNSLLLDFISPWNVRVLPRALGLRHYAVALGIVGSILIKILIVVSTALFVSEDRVFERHSPSLTKDFQVQGGYNGENADILPRLYLEATNSSQQSYPLGTSPEFAFQSYVVPSSAKLANPAIHATVDIFSSDLICQEAEKSNFANGYGEASAPGCNMSWTSTGQQLRGPVFLMQNGACEADSKPLEAEQDQRFMICAMEVTLVSNPGGLGNFGLAGPGTGQSLRANPITCLICSPTYSIRSGKVTVVGNTATEVIVSENQEPRKIAGLSEWQMGMSVFHSLGATPPSNFLAQDAETLVFGNSEFRDLVYSMTPAEDYPGLYTNASTLESASRKVFRRLGAQNARLHFMSATNDTTVEVFFETIESRLCVQPPIFFATIILLSIVTTVSILLATFSKQHPVICKDPGTILGLAAIIAKSRDVLSKFREYSYSTWDGLKTRLSREQYQMAAVDGQQSHLCRIDTQSYEAEARENTFVASKKDAKPWMPFTITASGGTVLCAVPIITVALLTGLLSKSERSQGIIDLPLDDRWPRYGWTLLPAAFLFGVKSFFELLERSIRTLQPFHILHGRHSRNKQKRRWKDYSELLALQRFWYALKYRHLAVMASTFAALAAPFLPIVASGLFSPGLATMHSYEVPVKTVGWFNTTSAIYAPGETRFNISDPMMTTWILYSNASFPQWTFSELALAEINLETGPTDINLDSYDSSAPPQLSVELPALRAVMNCTTQPYTNAATSATGISFLQINMTFPEHCVLKTQYEGYWTNANGTLVSKWVYKPGLIGYITPNMFEGSPCPTTMGLFGEVDEGGNPKELTVLTCTPYVEMVRANSIFELASSAKEPSVTPIESSATYFNDDSFWAMDLPLPRRGTFDSVLIPVNLSTPSPLSASDGFFQALFQGFDAVADPRSLLGSTNSDSLIAAMEHLYRIIMAQCLHSVQGRRLPVLNAADVPQPGSAVITDMNKPRLYQSATATYIIVALLTVMFICAAITLLTFKPKGLSKEPTTIAARVSLMSRSGLLERMPEDAAWATDAELQETGVADGLVLRSDRWPKKGFWGVDYGVELEYKAQSWIAMVPEDSKPS